MPLTTLDSGLKNVRPASGDAGDALSDNFDLLDAYITATDDDIAAIGASVAAHIARTDNPHAVTKTQVGLSNVPNTDATARANHTGTQAISTVTSLQASLDAKVSKSGDTMTGNLVMDDADILMGSARIVMEDADISGEDSNIYFRIDGTQALRIDDNGRLRFGSASDTNLYTSAANTLETDDAFTAASLTVPNAVNAAHNLAIYSSNPANEFSQFYIADTYGIPLVIQYGLLVATGTPIGDAATGNHIAFLSGDMVLRSYPLGVLTEQWRVSGTGVMTFGAAGDTNLYTSAANTLKTDDAFIVGGDLYKDSTGTGISTLQFRNNAVEVGAISVNNTSGEIKMGATGFASYFPVIYSGGAAALSFAANGNATFNGTATATRFVGEGVSPVGSITMYGAASAPTGWLLCNGTAVSRTTYAALFAVIGTTYGPGNGTTTFELPSFGGRFAVGQNGGSYTVGTVGGNETVTLTTNELPSHQHSISSNHGHNIGGSGSTFIYQLNVSTASADTNADGSQSSFVSDVSGSTASESNPSSTDSADAGTSTDYQGSSTPFNIMPPHVGVSFIIKT